MGLLSGCLQISFCQSSRLPLPCPEKCMATSSGVVVTWNTGHLRHHHSHFREQRKPAPVSSAPTPKPGALLAKPLGKFQLISKQPLQVKAGARGYKDSGFGLLGSRSLS